MLKQVEFFVILIILLLSIGCSGRKPISISDCEQVKNELKRSKCLANLVGNMSSDNTSLKIEICDKIVDTEIRDLCFFKIARDNWKSMPYNLSIICKEISNPPLRDSCKDMCDRPHTQKIWENL